MNSVISKYSLWELMKAYKENKTYLKNYRFGGENSVEFYRADPTLDPREEKLILGLSAGVFMTVVIITLVLWIWALVALLTNANRLETWAIILSVIFLLVGFPIGTLFVVYLARKPEYKFF